MASPHRRAPLEMDGAPRHWGAHFGLSDRDLTIYLAFYAEDHASTRAVATRTGLPTSQVREGVEILQRHELLHPYGEQAEHFRALSPEIPLRRTLARKEERVATQQAEIDHLRSNVEDFLTYCRSLGEPRTSVEYEHLESREETALRLQQGCNRTERELIVLRTAKRHDSGEQQMEQFSQLTERGVRVRLMVRESHVNDRETARHLRFLAERGLEIKVAPSIPTWLYLFDRSTLILPHHPDDIHQGTVLIRTPSVLAWAATWVDQLWQAGRDLPGRPALSDDNSLQPLERELITILAQGAKDDTAARQLGVSARTIRRMVSDLCERADADSRFQLGVRAHERGWI